MDLKFIGAGLAGMPPYVKPVFNAFSRLQQRTSLQPGELTDRAQTLLAEQFGVASGTSEAAFAHGVTGLISEHTHYFDGFALLMPLPHGTAVAARIAAGKGGRMVFEGEGEEWTFGAPSVEASAQRPTWVCLVEQVVQHLAPAGAAVEVAVVSTVRSAATDGYLAALGMATARVLQAVFALPRSTAELVRCVADVIAACIEHPFSVAYPLAADAGFPHAFLLLDTATVEYLPLDAPSHDVLGWGLIDVGTGLLREADFYRRRKQLADKALERLRQKSFPELRSYRELDYRDLQQALSDLPRRYRSVVRHLVSENHRIQRMVVAIRRADWQMFGVLLLMTHASLSEEWDGTHPAVDFVVQLVRDMSIDGMYGACMTDAGGSVLAVGQPFIVPQCLDRIKEAMRVQFDVVAETELL